AQEPGAANDADSLPQDPPTPPDSDPDGGCPEGYTVLGGKCACDLSGTFAFHGQVAIELSGQSGIEDASDTSQLWAIVRSSYEGDALTLAITDCGQATPDICGSGTSLLVDAEAYAQYTPAKVWRKTSADASPPVSLPELEALPGTSFVTPEFALLQGISLDDPAGEWPSSRKDVRGGSDFDGSAVNGARWLDDDQDGALGVTSYIVPPGGIASDGSATAPAHSYGATSMTCPRSDPSAPRSPYAYVPVLQGVTLRRIKRLQQATRVTASLSGQLESCDRISGDLHGPDDGAVRIEMRIAGCTMVNGSGESACASDLLDLAEGSNTLGAGVIGQPATFVMKRAADDVTCADVRATDFE
ncbi:MAG TPA: hypothetical protein VG963_02470, partial [Polyangiaceae bacterium]|nr:hypothetical protein [Polyangiaceae bacterium]